MASALCGAILALFIAANVAPDAARARVVLLGPEPTLARALTTALAPWNIELVAQSRATDDSATEARAVAAAKPGTAVVWLSPSTAGTTLFVYDGINDQLVTRPFGATTTLDEPLAAAVALSVKTMLRFTPVAPEAERFGSPPEPAIATAFPPRPVGGSGALPRFWGEAFAGTRLAGASRDHLEPTVGFGLSFWPRAAQGRLGAAMELRLGAGRTIDAAGFSGRFTDTVVSAALRGRLGSARWSAQPSAGGSVHISTLQGSTPVEGPVRRARVNPSLDAGLRIAFHPTSEGALEIGVAIGARATLREQRYLLAGEPLWQTPRWVAQTELVVALPFP